MALDTEKTLVEPPEEGGTSSIAANKTDPTQDFSGAGSVILKARANKKLSIRSILFSPAGQQTLRIDDEAGNNLLPTISFDTAGGVHLLKFLKGQLEGAVNSGLKVITSIGQADGMVLTAFIKDV